VESTVKYYTWTRLESSWNPNSSPFQLEFIPVQSESLADVKCFSSGRTIPVDSSGIHWNPLESSWNWWGT